MNGKETRHRGAAVRGRGFATDKGRLGKVGEKELNDQDNHLATRLDSKSIWVSLLSPLESSCTSVVTAGIPWLTFPSAIFGLLVPGFRTWQARNGNQSDQQAKYSVEMYSEYWVIAGTLFGTEMLVGWLIDWYA